MQGPIYRQLTPVRRRQQGLLVLRSAIWGLLAGSVAGIALGVSKWLTEAPVSGWVIALVIAAGPVLGVVVGLICRRTWRHAAEAVDSHYQLKDRAATALNFLNRLQPSVLHELQIEDTGRHLSSIKPEQVVPFRMPRTLAFAGGALVIALVVLLWPTGQQAVDAGPPEPFAPALAEGERHEDVLKEWEEVARQEKDKELQKLVEELRQKAQELQEPGLDQKEALAKISEMQSAIQAMQAQYNTGLVDAQLMALGDALTASDETEGAGKAMLEAKFEKAAEELEKIEDPEFDRKEAKALEEKLKQVAQACGQCGMGALSQCISEMAEGVKGGRGQFKKASSEVAKAVRGNERRRRVNNMLAAEYERLKEGKCNCQGGGGQKVKDPYKSTSPSSSWGREISGNVIGNKTNLLSQRQLEQITGNPDDGPSEVETQHSAEGRQQAARKYRDVYQKYRRMSEAVLDSEPIPLGHRQTIRKYFELIRPQQGEMEKQKGEQP